MRYKMVVWIIVAFTIVLTMIGLLKIYRTHHYGVVFNSVRDEYGIPKIDNNWDRQILSDRILFINLDSLDVHYRKEIELDYLNNVKNEIDFFELKSGAIVNCYYSYDSHRMIVEYRYRRHGLKNITMAQLMDTLRKQ